MIRLLFAYKFANIFQCLFVHCMQKCLWFFCSNLFQTHFCKSSDAATPIWCTRTPFSLTRTAICISYCLACTSWTNWSICTESENNPRFSFPEILKTDYHFFKIQPIPVTIIAKILRQLCIAIDFLQRVGIIHRYLFVF